MLPKESAETLFGSRIGRDQIFMFSSRGGESAKPDVLAPGVASSSTPRWDSGDIKGGTSMAAPQITGAYTLLASAAAATKTRVSSATLKRALLGSARPLTGYGLVDQGAGVPDVAKAFEIVRRLAGADEPFQIAGYRVTTSTPTSDGEVEGAVWRAGTYVPTGDETHAFAVEAIFYESAAKQSADFQQILTFDAEANWIRVDRDRARLRGPDAEPIMVRYDTSDLRTPGIYSGRVLGTPDGGAGVPALSLWTTVVVPYTFDAGNAYGLDTEVELAPGEVARFPVLVPPGATSLSVELHPGKHASVRLYAFDPAGRPVDAEAPVAAATDQSVATLRIGDAELTPGTWELVLYASHRERQTSEVYLSVRFRGLDYAPVRTLSFPAGQAPSGRVSVTNRYDVRFQGSVTGSLTGFRRQRTVKAEGEMVSQPFSTNADVARVDFSLQLSAKAYARFTDVAITILDEEGTALEKSGFVNGKATIGVQTDGAARALRLDIRGAVANSDAHSDPWNVEIVETWTRRKVITIAGGDVTLWPSVVESVDFELDGTPPRAPDGFENAGSVILTDRRSREVWAEIPVRVK